MPGEPSAPSFSASETVYFHPEAFAREKSLLDAARVLHTDTKYDGSELGGAILLAALLDAQKRGAVTLEAGKASRLFGLRKVDVVRVGPGPKADDAPPQSLDGRIRPYVEQRPGPVEAADVFMHLLREDAPDPWSWAISLVERGLAERGLVEVREEKHLKVFRARVHILPEATAALGRATPVAPVKELLDRAQRERPDLWRLLQAALKAAVSRRTEQDLGDD